MTQQFKFGDCVRYKSPESKLRGFVASTRNRGQNKIIVAFEGEDWLHHCSSENLELIPNPDTARLDWMILRDYPGDMGDEDRAFTLQAERENIDTFIRLDAEQGAAA